MNKFAAAAVVATAFSVGVGTGVSLTIKVTTYYLKKLGDRDPQARTGILLLHKAMERQGTRART